MYRQPYSYLHLELLEQFVSPNKNSTETQVSSAKDLYAGPITDKFETIKRHNSVNKIRSS